MNESLALSDIVQWQANNLNTVNARERAESIKDMAQRSMYGTEEFLAPAMEGYFALSMLADKKKENRAMGELLLSELEKKLGENRLLTRFLFNPELGDYDKSYMQYKDYVNAFSEIPEALMRKVSYEYPLTALFMDIVAKAGTKLNFAEHIDRHPMVVYSIFLKENYTGNNPEFIEALNIYTNFVLHVYSLYDDVRTINAALDIRRSLYTRFVNVLTEKEFPSTIEIQHPFQKKWGGISIDDIKKMSDDERRNIAILHYCASLPKGDVFWHSLTYSIFLLPSFEYEDPHDKFADIAACFSCYIGNNLLRPMGADHNFSDATLKEMLAHYSRLELSQLPAAFSHILESSKTIFPQYAKVYQIPFVQPDDIYPTLCPSRKNIYALQVQRSMEHSRLSKRFGRNNAVIEVVQAADIACDHYFKMFKNVFALSQSEMESVLARYNEQLGESPELLRDVLVKSMLSSTNEDEISYSFPGNSIFMQLGLSMVGINRMGGQVNIVYRFSKTQPDLSFVIDRDGKVRDMSDILPNHKQVLPLLVDGAMIAVGSQDEQSYPIYVLKHNTGIPVKFPIDAVKLRSEIAVIEKDNALRALKKRQLFELAEYIKSEKEKEGESRREATDILANIIIENERKL